MGAYAVQLSSRAGLHIFATASARDREYVTGLGTARVIDYRQERFEEVVPPVDVVIDTVGGETRERSYSVLKPGGILVSAVTPFPETGRHPGVREAFFIVDVTTARLSTLTTLFDSGKLAPKVGTILPLDQVREAHEMLGGAPHKRGKIVLSIAD